MQDIDTLPFKQSGKADMDPVKFGCEVEGSGEQVPVRARPWSLDSQHLDIFGMGHRHRIEKIVDIDGSAGTGPADNAGVDGNPDLNAGGSIGTGYDFNCASGAFV